MKNEFIVRLNRMPLEKRFYTLQNLPNHLTVIGKSSRLYQLLINFDFVQTKIEAFEPQMVIRDYEMALNSDLVVLKNDQSKIFSALQNAIRLSSEALSKDAKQTYAQLYARLFKNNLLQALLNAYKPRESWLKMLSTSMVPHPALIQTLVGHTDWVEGCALSKDGKNALSASSDCTLRVWNLEISESEVLEGHSKTVSACSLSGDAKLALSASHDGTLRLWDLENNGICLNIFKEHQDIFKEHQDKVLSCVLSNDGKLALSIFSDNTLRIWNTNTGLCQFVLEGHTDVVTCCDLSNDGKIAVSGSYDTTLRLWDTETGKCLGVIDQNFGAIVSCSLSGDGHFVLSACATLLVEEEEKEEKNEKASDTPEFWDIPIRFYKESEELSAEIDDNTSLYVSNDNDIEKLIDFIEVAPTEEETVFKLWDVKSGKCLQVFKGHKSYLYDCKLSKNGQYALSTAGDGTVRIWDTKNGSCLSILKEAGSCVPCCAINESNNFALSVFHNTLKLWNIKEAIKTSDNIDNLLTSNIVGFGYSKRRVGRGTKPTILGE
jgi:WD40 repeat protein